MKTVKESKKKSRDNSSVKRKVYFESEDEYIDQARNDDDSNDWFEAISQRLFHKLTGQGR